MVLQKRLDSSFNGYHLPAIPKSTRSVRRRRTFRTRQDEKHMRAFDLLATVAGNLLIEKENSASSTSMEKKQPHFVEAKLQEEKLPKNESLYEGSHEKTYDLYQMLPAYDPNYSSKGSPNLENDVHSGSASVTSSCSDRFVVEKFVNDKSRICSKIKLGSSACVEISSCRLDVENKINDEMPKVGKVYMGTESDIRSAQDPVGGKDPVVISLHSGKFSSDEDCIPHSSSRAILNNVKLVSRDDDDNSSGCTHPYTTAKTFSSVGHIGESSIRKILGSKYWNLAPKHKGEMISSNDDDLRAIFRSRKDCCKRLSSQMNIPFKKRNFFHLSSVSNSGRVTKNNDNPYSLNEEVAGDSSCSPAKIRGVPRISPAIASQQSSETHVKLRIKSFRVPELLVEIPETATVGSLKRTVMEAVSTIFGGGLHVGIILRGKNIRDDDKTLVQSGISCDNQVDALGFTLEPNSAQNIPSIFPPADAPTDPSSNITMPLARYSPDASFNYQMIKELPVMSPDIQLTKIVNSVQSDYDSAPSSNTSTEKGATDFNALVHLPEKCSKALALVPAQGKPKQSEFVQRRIRRPFSVAEVEALVRAVEKLGTGRWRDVKLRAFNSANHRTYVDLKDKWKTLVHTARISPQQRRGEPVPQVLLDRVLAAHAYWSQQQTKQQNKCQPKTSSLA